MKKFLQFVLFLLFFAKGFSQTFPVQIVPQAVPPHPVYISEYAKNTVLTNRLRAQLLLNDISITNQEVRLKIYIEGQGINAQSKDVVIGSSPLFLEGGVPLQLGSSDLAPYFEFQNLQGISSGIYSNPLPEGVYQFCFEVYDVFTGNRLSQKSCTSFILFQNQPPFLNLPFNKTAITEQNPQNIIFQWTPRHINVSNIQYEFSLVEIWDDYIDPQAAFLASPPIYQEITSQTTLIFGPSYPLLLSGRKYAWRVRAFAADGQDEIGVFNNNGYSEVFWFTYQTRCEAPLFPNVDEVSYRNAKLSWQGSLDNLDYTVLYREKNSGSQWYEITTPRQYITIDNLAPETTYEFKLKGHCDSNAFGETPLYDFTTRNQAESAYMGCNIEPDPIDIQNQELLPELFVNDVITAGDFPVTVLSLDQASTPFKGKGYVVVPWLGDTRIAVTFENIKVNSDFKLISGVIETTYDADWGNVDFVDEALEVFEGNSDKTPIEVNFDITVNEDGTINGIEINANGELQITDPATGIVITYPPGDDYVIKDNNGDSSQDVFYVDEKGNITAGGEAAEGGSIDTANTPGFASNGQIEKLTAKGIKVTFNTDGNYTYGVDKIIHSERSKLKNYYKTIQDEKGNLYDIVHKAVKNGGDDIIVGEIETDNEELIHKLVFKTAQGAKIEHTVSGKTVTLNLKGHFTFESEDVYATLQDNDGIQTTAGVFTLWHLSQEDVNVVVVPIGTAKIPDNLQNNLNAIYNPAVVQLNITEADPINIDESVWDIETTNKRLDVGESGWFANYTPEQRAIINYYEQQKGKNPNAYYIFITNIIPSRGIEGFMPLGRQHGFIFTSVTNGAEESKESITQVIAHELGHGVFGLEHPFTQLKTTESATNWLMDYASGNTFNHIEWAKIHNPDFDLYRFQRDEQGQSVSTTLHHSLSINKKKYICQDGKCEENPNGKYYFAFLAPDGRRIVLSEDYIPTFYHGIENDKYTHIVPGTLIGFIKRGITPDQNITYRAVLSSDGLILEGYNGYKYTPPPLSDDDKSVVVGIPYAGNQGSQGKWRNYKFILTDSENYDDSESSVMNILSDEFKNFGFFSNLKPSEVRTIENTANILGEEQYSITESELSILRGRYFEIPEITDFTLKITGLVTVAHEEKPEVFLLIKIAELENRYRVLFENHSKWFDNWHIYALAHNNYLGIEASIIAEIVKFRGGYWDKENVKYETIGNSESLYNKWKNNLSSQAGSSELYDFYRSFITSLRDYTDNRSEENFDCLTNLGEQTAEKIFECVAAASDDEIISKIDQPNRQKALKTLAAYGGKYDIYLDAGEDVIRRLIKYVPETEFKKDEFLDYLANTMVNLDGFEVPVWKLIFDKVDDSRFLIPDSDNRNAVIYHLLKLYYKSDKYKNQLNDILTEYQEEILDANISGLDALKAELYPFKNEYQNILRRSFTYVKSASPTMGVFFDPDDYYFSLDASYDEQTKKIDLSQQLKWGFDGDPTHIEEDQNPFDLKLMLNLSRNTLLTKFSLKNADGKPESLPLPAIVLYYISEVDGLQTKEDIIQTSIDLVTLPLPAANATGLARLFYYADKISSVSSLMGTYNREGNEELADFYNKLSLVTGVTSIGDVFLNSNKTLRTVIDQKSLTKRSSDLLDDSIDFIETIDPNSVSKLNDAEKNVAREILKDNLEDFKELGIVDAPKILKFENAISALNELDAFVILLTSIEKSHPKLHAELLKITDGTVKLRFIEDFGNSLTDLKKIDEEIDLLTLWKKWGDPEDELIKLTGKRVADIDDLKYLKHVLGKDPPQYLNSFEDFYKKSKWQIGKVDDPKFAARCYEALLENTAMAASEKLLKIYDDYASVLKVGGKYDWPVNDGFYRISKTDAPAINSHFDRFDNNQEIGGSFASPVTPAVSSPTHSSRALKENFSDFSTADNDYYHHLFKVLKPEGVIFEQGKALPWFGKLGEAPQIKSNQKLIDLLRGGKIEIIKSYHFTNGKWLKHVDDITEKLADANLVSAFKKDWENTAFRNLFENASDAEIDGLVDAWKYLNDAGVDETLRRNIDALADPDAVLDAIQMSQKAKPTWPEIQALWKRGNDFNAIGRNVYRYNEVTLSNGKRLDSYIPGKEIISRKATTLSEIQPSTFEGYLRELITKYKKGSPINAPKFGTEFNGKVLEGDYFLEIPTSNKAFFESSVQYQKVLSDFNITNNVDIKIKYLDE